MKLALTLNSSLAMASTEDFAHTMRLLADQISQAPVGIPLPVYGIRQVRVGTLTITLSEVCNVAPGLH